MKTGKRFLALLLVCAVFGTMTACKADKKSNAAAVTTDTTAVSTATEKAEETTAATTEAVATEMATATETEAKVADRTTTTTATEKTSAKTTSKTATTTAQATTTKKMTTSTTSKAVATATAKATTTRTTTVSNNTSSSGNTNSSTVVDNYVYKNPTVYVDGMYTLDNVLDGKWQDLYMGDVYVDLDYVAQFHIIKNNYTNTVIVPYDIKKHVITDVSKMPSNYKYYPYVVDTIPNWLYEKGMGASNYIYPAKMYALAHSSYIYYWNMIYSFYETVGNIDYETLDKDYMLGYGLYGVIYSPYGWPIEESKIDEYISYVKSNKIKFTTKADVLFPIVYCKGDYLFVRTKITVNVESSNTNDIKMFMHKN